MHWAACSYCWRVEHARRTLIITDSPPLHRLVGSRYFTVSYNPNPDKVPNYLHQRMTIAALLIKGGADVNATPGFTPPLHLAAQVADVDMARLLLTSGANGSAAENGATALHRVLNWCGGEETIPVVRILLENGTAVDARNVYGYTPSSLRCKDGHPP